MGNREVLAAADSVNLFMEIKPFQQKQGWCLLYTTWWLKQRIKNKNRTDFENVINDATDNKFNKLDRVTKDAEVIAQYLKNAVPKTEVFTHSYRYDTHGFRKVLEDEVRGLANGWELLIRLSFETKNGVRTATNHAVGIHIDFVGYVHYFDPNLGQVSFPDGQTFIKWWERSLQSEVNQNSAFGLIKSNPERFAYHTYSFSIRG